MKKRKGNKISNHVSTNPLRLMVWEGVPNEINNIDSDEG